MPQAIVDPDEVRQFRIFLDALVVSLKSRQSSLNSNFTALKEVWRDEKYVQFERLFFETMSQLGRFCNDAEKYVQYLRSKEEKARRYLEDK
jgi:hypothetical protein